MRGGRCGAALPGRQGRSAQERGFPSGLSAQHFTFPPLRPILLVLGGILRRRDSCRLTGNKKLPMTALIWPDVGEFTKGHQTAASHLPAARPSPRGRASGWETLQGLQADPPPSIAPANHTGRAPPFPAAYPLQFKRLSPSPGPRRSTPSSAAASASGGVRGSTRALQPPLAGPRLAHAPRPPRPPRMLRSVPRPPRSGFCLLLPPGSRWGPGSPPPGLAHPHAPLPPLPRL